MAFFMQNYHKPSFCKLPRDTLFVHQVWFMKMLVVVLEGRSPRLGNRRDMPWLLGELMQLAAGLAQGPCSAAAVSQVQRLRRERVNGGVALLAHAARVA